jgi:uncharacterized membrane protein
VLHAFIRIAAAVMEAVGVLVIITGAAVSVALALRHAGRDQRYRGYRRNLGRSILLGLEFLVAADIIRTITAKPSLRGLAALAVIVAVRTFLSFTLEMEINGRWPWQRATPAAGDDQAFEPAADPLTPAPELH